MAVNVQVLNRRDTIHHVYLSQLVPPHHESIILEYEIGWEWLNVLDHAVVQEVQGFSLRPLTVEAWVQS